MSNIGEPAATERRLTSVGSIVDQVFVTIGPQFLNRFSEHLYSSPNKAFEELVSNSWDAGAAVVYIGIPDDLENPAAAVWILDDGEAMDVGGFHDLWAVASEHKRTKAEVAGRKPVGKFGVGKLATYLLYDELTYICKASDGKIRAVTMEYSRIDKNPEWIGKLHMDKLPLDVRELTSDDLIALLAEVPGGDRIQQLLDEEIPRPEELEWQDEYGGEATPQPEPHSTWTLAIMSSLKDAGKELKQGWIRWLLRTALPLGNSMTTVLNNEVIVPRKVDATVAEEWELSVNSGLESVTLADGIECSLTEHAEPVPHLEIEGIPGWITGTVRLYEEKISGGKSEEYEASNGFHVNILGRVINVADSYFGLTNLNHSAWAKFRATIRADGLDNLLSVNREGVKQSIELEIFRAFLMALFNKVRKSYDALTKASWPKAGQILTDSWSSVPLAPLVNVIKEGLTSATGLPAFVDSSRVEEYDVALEEWVELAKEPGQLIENVVFQALSPEDHLVAYDLAAKNVVVNRNHPFAREHLGTREEQELLRDAALADLLTQAWMLESGISDTQLAEIQEYKEQSLRLIALVRRRSGVQIAELLIGSTANAKALETILTDALDYLGFYCDPLGQPGEPEGVATAPTPPGKGGVAASYKFTYDAKSSKTGKVTTGNLKISALVRHRDDHGGDHILVVGPDYQDGALQKECKEHGVTPMRARDLASLLMLSGSLGPLNLNEFREVFEFHDPDDVHDWVAQQEERIRSRRTLSLGQVLKTLVAIGFQGPNTISAAVIADRIGSSSESSETPVTKDVKDVVRGLAVLVPGLVRINGDDVLLSTSPEKLREAILAQIGEIPDSYRFGLDEQLKADGD